MKKHKYDIIAVSAVVLLGVLICLFTYLFSGDGKYVQVRVSSSVVKTFPLDVDVEYDITGKGGGINKLIIKDGSAYVKSASCPDGLCVNMGKIKYSGQSIICLPNEVVVEIIGDMPASDEPDVVSG